MGQFWKATKASVNDLGYRTAARDMESPSPMDMWRLPRKDRSGVADSSPASWRTGMGKTTKGGKGKEKDLLKPSKLAKIKERTPQLQRETRALLNKICPENKEKIIKQVGEISIESVEDMQVIIGIIFHKVTDDPHYCETYVDMIHSLHTAYPEFPAEEEGEAPTSFRRMLVNMCQDKFEEMVSLAEEEEDPKAATLDPDELLEQTIKKKRNCMATMKFIGNLFVRQLLAAAVIRRIVGDLLNGEAPLEMHVEYALELVIAVGHQFEHTDKDKGVIHAIMSRLADLKSVKGPNGKPILSKRVQFSIDDLKDMRENGWVKKGQQKATTKEEVAKVAEREDQQAAQAHQAASRPARGGYGGHGGRRH